MESGRILVCDAEKKSGDRKMSLVCIYYGETGAYGKLILKAPPEFEGYEPHWSSCLEANRLRNRERERTVAERKQK
jgi:hypothetical protein